MAEYIEREAAIKLLHYNADESCSSVVADFEALPTADVVPVVHGEWIVTEKWASKAQYKCSVCGRRIMASLDAAKVMGKYPYCNCGAKMEEAR